MLKKDENVDRLQSDLQASAKELATTKGILAKVSQERDIMWEEVKQFKEKNMLLNSEINVLKKKIEALEEDILLKEGQITILKDTLGSRPFDLLGSSPSCTREFLLE
jgi:chromosome segregation ATPase